MKICERTAASEAGPGSETSKADLDCPLRVKVVISTLWFSGYRRRGPYELGGTWMRKASTCLDVFCHKRADAVRPPASKTSQVDYPLPSAQIPTKRSLGHEIGHVKQTPRPGVS